MKTKDFLPDWFEGELPRGSYRSLFKWGDPGVWKHPNKRLYRLMKETFGLSDADFAKPRRLGLETLPDSLPEARSPGKAATGATVPTFHADRDYTRRSLGREELESLSGIVGADNVSTALPERLRASYGKTLLDLERLREGLIEGLPDAVLYPRSRDDLRAILDFAGPRGIPVYVRGGGSSVTRGCEAVRGGVSIDMGRHLKRVLAFDETNQTITVEAGMSGPELEAALAEAPTRFGSKRAYTAGHFPQSFEYSSVGGWIVTRGAGQNST
ncbi:MAG TPA: FAD-dependent oxidoreductase, partial [Rectinemataceae bacterium]|nr:FAD-dependent oxidoreductase [Rectinemataceae bacterium]